MQETQSKLRTSRLHASQLVKTAI